MKPFKPDLLIATFEDNEKVLRLIPEDVWKDQKYRDKVTRELGASVDYILNLGTVLAAVPATDLVAGGASCYLVNLASINVDPWEKNEAEARPAVEPKLEQRQVAARIYHSVKTLGGLTRIHIDRKLGDGDTRQMKDKNRAAQQPGARAGLELEGPFLHVTLDVPKDRTEKFDEQMKKLIPMFTQRGEDGLGWDLAVSAYLDLKDATRRYLHVWKTNGDPQLFEAMTLLSSDPEYAALNGCVTQEVQHILHTDDTYSPANLPKATPKKILYERFRLPTNDAAVATQFRAGMAAVSQKMTDMKWKLLIALQSETGLLGSYVQLWEVPDEDIREASNKLTSQDIYKSAVRGREAEVYTANEYK